MTEQILSDNVFQAQFASKSHTDRDITSIQTCLKSSQGLGTPFYVKFFAELNQQDPDGKIKYDFRAFGDSGDLAEHD